MVMNTLLKTSVTQEICAVAILPFFWLITPTKLLTAWFPCMATLVIVFPIAVLLLFLGKGSDELPMLWGSFTISQRMP